MTKFIDIVPTKKEFITYGLAASILLNLTFGIRLTLDVKEHQQEVEGLRSEVQLVDDELQMTLSRLDERENAIKDIEDKNDILMEENERLRGENDQLKKELDERKVFEVTAYTSGYESTQKRKGEKWYGITASGEKVKEGVTVACPKSMPFGTKVHIEGVGIRTCQDRGGAIIEGHLDLYMESVSKAKKFGRQKLKIEIVEKG